MLFVISLWENWPHYHCSLTDTLDDGCRLSAVLRASLYVPADFILLRYVLIVLSTLSLSHSHSDAHPYMHKYMHTFEILTKTDMYYNVGTGTHSPPATIVSEHCASHAHSTIIGCTADLWLMKDRANGKAQNEALSVWGQTFSLHQSLENPGELQLLSNQAEVRLRSLQVTDQSWLSGTCPVTIQISMLFNMWRR